MSEEWTINLPEDVSERLSEMDEGRVSRVVSDALREALDLQETAEERQEELREKMGLQSQDSEELTEDSPEESEVDVEAKQKELRDKITRPR